MRSLEEFNEKKNKLVEQRKDIEEKLSDFERKENQPLELLKNWIFEANQAHTLIVENKRITEKMKLGLVCGQAGNLLQTKKFSRNEKFFENRRLEPPKIPYCETYSIVFSQCVINGAGRRIFAKSLIIDFQKACGGSYE